MKPIHGDDQRRTAKCKKGSTTMGVVVDNDATDAPPHWEGILLTVAIYVVCYMLHAILPGSVVTGYACSEATNKLLSYKLNGLLVLVVSLIEWILVPTLFLATSEQGYYSIQIILKSASMYQRHYMGMIVGANICGMLMTIALYQRGYHWCQKHDFKTQEPLRCSTDEGSSPSVSVSAQRQRALISLPSFFRGIGEFNPSSSFFGKPVDLKMWLYLAGAVMLQLQVLSMVAAHVLLQSSNEDCQTISRAVAVSSLAWTWFMVDYLLDEHIHLYTYDIFAERLGFKLVWGCLTFYPFLYPIGQTVLVRKINNAEDLSWTTTIGIACLFWSGWILTRGANYQKYMFKIHPEQTTILGGLIRQTAMVVPPTTDQPQPRKLLVSGFWGLARHVNFLGEILQGLALGLPSLIITQSPVSLAYFCLITAILVPRQYDDDKLCRSKYGDEAWDAYTQFVPYKIIPGVY